MSASLYLSIHSLYASILGLAICEQIVIKYGFQDTYVYEIQFWSNLGNIYNFAWRPKLVVNVFNKYWLAQIIIRANVLAFRSINILFHLLRIPV
jgi:hypothetical protein